MWLKVLPCLAGPPHPSDSSQCSWLGRLHSSAQRLPGSEAEATWQPQPQVVPGPLTAGCLCRGRLMCTPDLCPRPTEMAASYLAGDGCKESGPSPPQPSPAQEEGLVLQR